MQTRHAPVVQHRPRLAPLLAIVAVLAACTTGGGGTPSESAATAGPSPSPAPASAGPETSPSPSAVETSPSPSAADSGSQGRLIQPWATHELVDVVTGDRFTIAGLVAEGRVVFLETMAIWCSNCRIQQETAMNAMARMDRQKVVWISLDVDPSERAEDLAEYRRTFGFEITYAIAGRDVSRALADEFGDEVLAPTSTPIIVIGTDGSVTLTPYGHKSADDLVALAASHGA
jgi:hypothetical protein